MSVSHLWLGLLSSIVVFVVCITGSIYTFKNQIIDAVNRDKVYVEQEDKPFISLDELDKRFQQDSLQLTALTIPSMGNRSMVASYTRLDNDKSGAFYVNPYSGAILGTGDYSLERFFSVVLGLHQNLLASQAGKQIVGASILIFVVMLISGLVLWWPKKWKQLKNGLRVRWKATFYRVNYDLHNVLGFYSLILLLFIAITGLYVSYPWMKSAIIVSLGGTPVLSADADEETQKELSDSFATLLESMVEQENEKEQLKEEKTASLDSILLLANAQLPYRAITQIDFPDENDPRFTIKRINRENWLKALLPDIIIFNKKGELKELDLFKDKPLNKQFVEISLPLHTGEIMGWPSLVFYFIASLIGCSLPITGFIIWWKKL